MALPSPSHCCAAGPSLSRKGERGFSEGAARLAGLAAAVLGWRPDDFWEATPAELATALGPGEAGDGPPERDEVEALIARFPD